MPICILVVDIFTIILRKGGKHICCKTFLYRKIEITRSKKLLFCILNRNYFVIKLFLSLYLRICVHMCIINGPVHGMCICSFMFSLPLFGLIMTTSYCSSPLLRFTKSYWIYVLVYIYWETKLSFNRFVLLFRREMTWSWQYYFCLTVMLYVFGLRWLGRDARIFIHFLGSVWKWHTLFMCSVYCIE